MNTAQVQAAAAFAALERGDLGTAERLARGCLAQSGSDAQALHVLAIVLAQTGRLAEALTIFERAVVLAAGDVDLRFNHAQALIQAGRLDAAASQLRLCVAAAPQAAPLHLQLGAVQLALGQNDEAARSYQAAVRLDPADADAHYNLGLAVQRSGDLAGAEAAYRAAIARRAAHADAYNNLGLALGQQGRHPEAIAALERAVELRPGAGSLCNLAGALRESGRTADAAARYRAALESDPGLVEARFGLGLVLNQQEDWTAAAECLRLVLAAQPNHFGALKALASSCLSLFRLEEAVAMLGRALVIVPDDHRLISQLAAARFLLDGDPIAAIRRCGRSLALEPAQPDVFSNRLLYDQYRADVDQAALLATHQEFEARYCAPLRHRWRPHENRRDPARRLRVGYVSPDFRYHSCAFFIEPLLQSHDRGAVEIHCYAQVAQPDDVTARLTALADRWVDIRRMGDDALEAQVRGDGIDILVDLAGHTADNRLTLFARKPAPVQVSWLGYPGPTGVAAFDWRISDAVVDPTDAPAIDRVFRLDRGFHCFRPAQEAAAVAPLPCLGAPFTFGCFNNLAKASDTTIAMWAKVLAAVPGSRLALKDGRLRDADYARGLLARFAAAGAAPERIVFVPPQSGPHAHLALYAGVDIALDTFPYTGVTTSCQGLWMGVPVVTRTGARHASRYGASLLAQLGHRDWIARDEAEFVAIAAHLAGDRAALAEIRTGLRARMAASALCDSAGFARSIDQAYRAMWREWCGAQN